MPLSALALACTLKPSPSESSSVLIGHQLLDEMATHGVAGELVRVVDHDVRFGVGLDEGNGDGWPGIRSKIMAADILVITTPIWMGQPSSVCKMALERLDAELSETDADGRMSTYGKVAIVGVVGNEDGAHHTCAEVFQALNDTGFTIPASGATYWVGEAMQSTDYRDLDRTPDATAGTNKTAAAHAVHLAQLLQRSNYPAPN
jgi:multimeric flavodoxin WrbA